MPARFWYYTLKGLDLGGLNRATAIPGLNREDVSQVDVILPPQTEQKRIADKLDAILTRVDACRERLTPALFAKAFRGELVKTPMTNLPPCCWSASAPRVQRQAKSRLER